MRGEFFGVWEETLREIWNPLAEQDGVPDDIFCELYREISRALKSPPSIQDLADTIDNPLQSREAFGRIGPDDLAGERALVRFFEAAHEALEELGGDELTNRYFILLETFIAKFSLRYDLRRPCVLCPTLPGMFTNLVESLDSLGDTDANVAKRLRDFKEALQDLRLGATESRIGSCVSKQVMLLEAIASAGGAAGTDLADLCKSVTDWPHPAVRSALLNLYGFASDFPGLRHGTPSRGMARDLDMRDLVATSILLTGFTPHLTRKLSAEAIYGGSSQGVLIAASAQPFPAPAGAPAGEANRAREGFRRILKRMLGRGA